MAQTALPGERLVARTRRRGAVRLSAVSVTRYRYRGAAIPSPWRWRTRRRRSPTAWARGEPDAVEAARPVRGRAGETDLPRCRHRARSDSTGPPRPSTRCAARCGDCARGGLGPARHGPQRLARRLVEVPRGPDQKQERKLAWIAKVNAPLYRAYLLKEQLREIVNVKGRKALRMLDAWLMWTARCRIPAFVELGRRVRKNRAGIEASLRHNLSNSSSNRPIRNSACCIAWRSAQEAGAPHRARITRPRPLLPAVAGALSCVISTHGWVRRAHFASVAS